ncbi:MAG: hypothetical protein ACRDJE_26900 [Dehalococcoidia bacterium]
MGLIHADLKEATSDARSDAPPVVDTSERGQWYIWPCRNGVQLKMSPSAYHLLKSVEGGASFEEIAAVLRQRQGGDVTAEEVAGAYQRLADKIAAAEARERRLPSGFLLTRTLMPAQLVRGLAGRLTSPFRPLPAGLLLLAAFASLWLVLRDGISLRYQPADYALGYGLMLAIMIAHELGHAAACARFGAPPSSIGVGVYLIFPVCYADVTAAWRLRRWQRVVVDLGGAYFQVLATACYALAFLVTGWAPFMAAVLISIYSGLFVLNPIIKTDGYWALADALGVTNLGQQPGRVFRHVRGRLLRQPAPPLPWPATIVAALAVYSVVTVAFWFYFVGRLVPLVWEQAIIYPELIRTLLAELLAASLPERGTLASLLFATYLLVMGWLFVRRLLWPLVRRGCAMTWTWLAPNPAAASASTGDGS